MVRILFVCMVSSLIFLSSCAGGKKRLAAMMKADTVVKATAQRDSLKNKLAVYNNVNKQLALYDENITFYGTTSDWDVLIQKDSILIFQSAKDTLRFLIAKKAREQDATIGYYLAKTQLGLPDSIRQKKQILLKITEDRYLEESSATYYPFSLEITLHDQTGKQLAYFSGGGFYLGNPRIHDIWAVDSLNDSKVSAEEYPNGVPTLEFHLDGGKLIGFAGCNNFSGTYYFVENRIQFNPPVSTLKMCMQMTAETSFLAMLHKKNYAYSFFVNRLTLLHPDGSSIVLKKVD